MKKYFLVFTVILICIIMIGCSNDKVTKMVYQGESLNWESTMNFGEDDKFMVNIKYIGEEELPLYVTFNIEYLSGNTSGGVKEYGELTEKIGGFTLEENYDKEVHGDISKYKNRDKLNIVMKWNDKEETIELKKFLD
ncbi:hypothetical protein QTJ04_07980 [Clostridium perfringens]|uniref:hypothetical protein n=1 Tax=Clostridium perfringens TaxID=1502 RepID=UPI001A347CC2|nr:hypothetical protein [Clostridium perfringens]EHK2388075.1 hypothetical protein [Clostridium perfringens]EHK2406590.1 hypothetical protein [Clostridium perfringens]EHK2441396.1 hypothetical protein [Clostridium perfringens]ELC8436488.1 hypothetical protein [Clostridium perfringens]MCX0411587.1 hypothetical protein [Clostridium perfringens]